jgi:hypothetical protein
MSDQTTVVSTDRLRSIYAAQRKSKRFHDKVITPGFLRLHATLKNSSGKYQFQLLKDNNSDKPTEMKLDRNDAFVVDSVCLALLKEGTGTEGLGELQMYPNPFIFNGANEARDLELVYNGKMSIRVGNIVYIEGMDTQRFRSVGTAQQNAATNRSERNRKTGFDKMTPQIVFEGDKKTEITVEFPTFTGNAFASSIRAENHLVLLFRGFHINGGSNNTQ